VLPHALHDRTDEGNGALERILPGCIARGNEALVDGGGELLVLDMISSSALVDAYRYKVPIATSALSAICCVVTPLTPCCASSSRGRGHDPLALVLLGPLAAPDRHVPVFHVVPS
jgi:hypothetical protein